MITKKIQKQEEFYIQFTDEELKQLNLKPNSKLDWSIEQDGSLKLTPWKTIDLDVENWSWDILYFLVKESLEKDLPVNDIIVDIIEKAVENIKDDSVNNTVPET